MRGHVGKKFDSLGGEHTDGLEVYFNCTDFEQFSYHTSM